MKERRIFFSITHKHKPFGRILSASMFLFLLIKQNLFCVFVCFSTSTRTHAHVHTYRDTEFYQDARMEQHVDDFARRELSRHHMRVVRSLTVKNPNVKILDICSSFESHFPTGKSLNSAWCFI
jgi:hypothetical protein